MGPKAQLTALEAGTLRRTLAGVPLLSVLGAQLPTALATSLNLGVTVMREDSSGNVAVGICLSYPLSVKRCPSLPKVSGMSPASWRRITLPAGG